ncbi:MAG: hypothetical protein K2G69_07050, partial [Muribaculaceae bacterium]|nr:hypothetical protein [Muribaculaceae bacterium]
TLTVTDDHVAIEEPAPAALEDELPEGKTLPELQESEATQQALKEEIEEEATEIKEATEKVEATEIKETTEEEKTEEEENKDE